MACKLFLFLGLTALARAAVISATPAVVATAPLAKLEEFDEVPQYSFAYNVQDVVTGDSKAQYETRNGDIVQGSYSLIEADGTRRIVEYTADPINGFNAIVSREPATAAITAVATPLVQLRPTLTPVAATIPNAPAIPAVGPDSDVEVVEARSGPLTAIATTREQVVQRQQQRQQLQQLQRLQKQQREQQEQQLRQLQQQVQEQQKQLSRLQIQPQYLQQQSQVQAEELQQQQQKQQVAAPVSAIAGQMQSVVPVANSRLISFPAAARAIATYPYTTYTAAYSSPLAYTVPVAALA